MIEVMKKNSRLFYFNLILVVFIKYAVEIDDNDY